MSIIGLLVFLIFKFWILKIPEIRLLFNLTHSKASVKLAKKKLSLTEQIDKDTDDMMKDLEENMKEVRKNRQHSKKTINRYIKEDL
jgi:hypothetical protein